MAFVIPLATVEKVFTKELSRVGSAFSNTVTPSAGDAVFTISSIRFSVNVTVLAKSFSNTINDKICVTIFLAKSA